jgi:hypothetical protein
MFDLLRNLTKSSDDKQQELLHAYLDDELTPAERQRFDQTLARHPDLQRNLAQSRMLKQQLRQLPRRPIPRSFQLDPAEYAPPQRQPLFQLYPAMRLATVMTAFFFILAVAADLFLETGGMETFSAPGEDVAMIADEAFDETAAEQMVEVTRVVTEMEQVVEEPAAEELEEIVEVEAAAESAAEESEPAEARAEPAASPAEAAEEGAPAEADGVDAEGESLVAAAPTAPAVGAVVETPTPAATVAQATSEIAETELAESDRSTAPTSVTSVAPPSSDPSDDEGQPETMPQPTSVSDLIDDDTLTAEPEVARQQEAPARQPLSSLRLIQVGLAIAVVLFAGLTYLARRPI